MKKGFLTIILSALIFVCLLVSAAVFLPLSTLAQEAEEVNVDNGIPVVYLNIDESRGEIKDMIESHDHSVYCYGTFNVSVPEGFRYSDMQDLACESLEGLEMSIRGRGNSTWENQDKKPFKIKLDKKTDVFGMGKNKHWVLVANEFDPTLLRDRITGWLGDEMGFAFTPRGVPVDVVMSGQYYGTQYLGSYYLSENVRVGENRLEIAELEETDTDPDIITGGYLIQNGNQVDRNSPDRFRTDRGAVWATNTPSFETEEESVLSDGEDGDEREYSFAYGELGDGYENHVQQDYIQNYVQMFEDVLFEDGIAYRDLMDMESAAKYWLVQEVTLNGDDYRTGSTYFYKDRDTEEGTAKIFWGPLWDFDYAWDHGIRTEGFPYGHLWTKPMLYDTAEGGFVQELYKQWPPMKEAMEKLIAEGGIIDQYYEETKASAEQDRILNHPEYTTTYLEDIEVLKKWIRDRIDWVDENLSMLETLIHKVTFIVDGEEYRKEFFADYENIEPDAEHPEKEGYVYLGWEDEEGNILDSIRQVTKDMVLTAKYITREEATHGEDLAFSKASDVIPYNSHVHMYQIEYTVIPTDAQVKTVEWSSSDESYATVDENGLVSFSGPGTVTLTGKLEHGAAREFTLTVLERGISAPAPQSIYPVKEVFELTAGSQANFCIATEPEPARIREYTYVSDDESVVTIGENGVLTAVGPGETKVHVTTVSYDENDEEVILETYVTVIVPDETPAPEIVYTFTDDSGSEWKKGSGTDLVITVKRSEEDETCFSHFTGVQIDGVPLAKDTGYTAVQGSTVITIKPAALQVLKTGTHTVTAEFDDGIAEKEINILAEDEKKDDAKPVSPDTSDSDNRVWPYITIAALLIFALALKTRLSTR